MPLSMWTALAALRSSRHMQGIRRVQACCAYSTPHAGQGTPKNDQDQAHSLFNTAAGSLLTVQHTEQIPRSSIEIDKRPAVALSGQGHAYSVSSSAENYYCQPCATHHTHATLCYDGEDAPSSAACSVTSAAVAAGLASSTAPGASGPMSAPASSSSVHAWSSASSSSASPVSSSAVRQHTD